MEHPGRPKDELLCGIHRWERYFGFTHKDMGGVELVANVVNISLFEFGGS
jgi:uncharacterized protein YmfQ (DUF2313 family)